MDNQNNINLSVLNGIISISLHNLVCFKAVFYNINAMKTDGRQQLFPILRISVLFALGIWTGESGLCTNGSWAWIFSSAILLLITVALHKHPVWQSVLLLVSSFSAGGSCVTASLEAQHATFNKGESAYEAVITSTPSVHGKVVMCDIMPTDMPRPFKIRASILRDERTSSLRVGDGISALSVLEQPHNSKGLAFDYARYLVRHGYSGQTFIYKTNWCLIDADSGNLPFFTRARLLALKYRQRLLDIYRHLGFDGDTFSVLSAMTLGDKENMTKELREQFSVSGASHVLALSGLHLGIIYAILSCLFVWRRRSVAGHVISLSAIWAYVFVTGMSPSTVRSALMISVYALAVMSGRTRMSLNALSAAALLMLAISPCDVFDVGFQMSFAAVFFILVFYRKIYDIMPSGLLRYAVVRRMWQLTAVSLAAQIGVAPLILLYFGRISCYFLITNFVVIPVTTFILYSSFLLLLFSFLPSVQTFLAAILVYAADFLTASVKYISLLPGSDISGVRLHPAQVFMFYIFVFASFRLFSIIRKMYVWRQKTR